MDCLVAEITFAYPAMISHSSTLEPRTETHCIQYVALKIFTLKHCNTEKLKKTYEA
jgi:hypothetical protein